MDVSVNGTPQTLSGQVTVADLLVRLALHGPGGIAVAVNNAVVPRGRHESTLLAPGDRIEIVTAVQGG